MYEWTNRKDYRLKNELSIETGLILSLRKNLAKQIKVCYTYDVLSRVIQRKTIKLSDNGEVIETYSYNSAGSLCTACGNESFRYDANNRLTEFSGKPVTYDADGNMLEASIGKFTYDSANRLTIAGTRYYAYDVEGTRIKTQKGEDTTEFVYNVNARLSQLLIKTENNAVTKYVYGLGLIGEETSGNFKTYHFDYRGSTVAITDSNCNITDTFTYDTYGKLKSRTGTTKTPFLYNGRDGVITEDDTGLIYMRARYYSPVLRRFVNADKVHGDISNALTLNRYSFVNGNPASNVDPLGLSAERGGSYGWNVNRTYHNYGNLYPLLMLEAPKRPLALNRYAYFNGNPAGNVDPKRLSAEKAGVGTAWSGISAMEQCMFQVYENNKKKNFTYWLGYIKELSKLALIERLDIDASELVLYSSGFGFVDKVLDIFKIVHYSRNYFNAEFPESSKDLKGLWNTEVASDCHQFSVPMNKRKDSGSRNKKYVSFDGHYEAIYGSGGEGQIVTDPRDVGTYNFISPAENKVGHGIVDVAPWVIWGNSYNDSTTISERIIFSIF